MLRPVFAALVLFVSATAGATNAGEIRSAIVRYNANSPDESGIPIPADKNLAKLLHGQVINDRQKTRNPNDPDADEVYRVVGYVVVPKPRLLVWAATLATTTRHASRLIEIPTEFDNNGGANWYQYLWLPWPISDRHWMLRTAKRLDLARATSQTIWEHGWQLADDGHSRSLELVAAGKAPGVEARQAGAAVYLPANRGGWVMVRLDDDITLVIVHATAALGGRLPEGWVARYVKRQLNHVLGRLEERSSTIATRFDESGPLFSGDGRRITSEMLLAKCDSINERHNEC